LPAVLVLEFVEVLSNSLITFGKGWSLPSRAHQGSVEELPDKKAQVRLIRRHARWNAMD
jgi:hypothetical protein